MPGWLQRWAPSLRSSAITSSVCRASPASTPMRTCRRALSRSCGCGCAGIVLFVIEHDELRRARDGQHYRLARQLRRTLLTLDRDYLNDRHFPPSASSGVIVVSAPDEACAGKAAQADRPNRLSQEPAGPRRDCGQPHGQCATLAWSQAPRARGMAGALRSPFDKHVQSNVRPSTRPNEGIGTWLPSTTGVSAVC